MLLGFSNYAIERELKDATVVDTLRLAAKRNLTSLKPEVEKLGTNKLVNVPIVCLI